MMNWFCKEESQAIEDILSSRGKLHLTDVHSLSKVPSIPGEAVEADLSALKEFFTDDAWKMVLTLVNEKKSLAKKKAWQCYACQQSRYMDMIQCESCLQWFDWECANLLDEPDEWICTACETNLMPPKKSPRLQSTNWSAEPRLGHKHAKALALSIVHDIDGLLA